MTTVMAVMRLACAGGNLLQCATVALFVASHAPAGASSPDQHHQHHDHSHHDHDELMMTILRIMMITNRDKEIAIDVLYHTYPHISLQEIGKRPTRVSLRQIVRLPIV